MISGNVFFRPESCLDPPPDRSFKKTDLPPPLTFQSTEEIEINQMFDIGEEVKPRKSRSKKTAEDFNSFI